MPSILSKDLSAKILGREWSFGYNCYEVGHTWTPSCTGAALEVSTAAGLKILPLYAMLYTFSQVAVQRKYDLPATWDTIKSISRSSFFIFFHAYNGSLMGCALRNGLGRFYYRVLVCAPALISSYFSLLIEKPSRRQALAFYMLNLASEIVYRMAVTKGYFHPIKHGETLLFAMSLGAWYHLLKTHGFGHDPVSAAVKVLIGRDEAKSRSRRHIGDRNKSTGISSGEMIGQCQEFRQNQSHEEDYKNYNEDEEKKDCDDLDRKLVLKINQVDQIQDKSLASIMMESVAIKLDSLGLKLFGPKQRCCPHAELSCLRYVVGPMPSRFLLGYLIQSLLKLTSKPILLIKDPSEALALSFTSPGSLRFGMFLMSLVSVGRATSCILRHSTGANEAWHGSVSGFLAGLSMLWAPRSSLSMYIMWKAVEQYYLKAHREGKVKYFDFTIMTIYAASASTILYTFALEPRFVRPSYMKFLDNLSDHRLHQLNRMVLDVFGTGSSIGYEDYFPDLDPKLMSNQFKELIFNWMIQPYE